MNCSCGRTMVEKKNEYGEYYECETCNIRQYGDGTPADKELRLLRIFAHSVFDKYWKWKQIPRNKAYSQLACNLRIKKDKAHMRFMTKEQCKEVIRIYNKKLESEKKINDKRF